MRIIFWQNENERKNLLKNKKHLYGKRVKNSKIGLIIKYTVLKKLAAWQNKRRNHKVTKLTNPYE